MRSRFLLALFVPLFSFGCKSKIASESTPEKVNFNSQELLKTHSYDAITPTGQAIMAASYQWVKGQEREAEEYAKPRMCAHNVSRVLETVLDLKKYSSFDLVAVKESVRKSGGLIVELPLDRGGIIDVINNKLGGRIPAGTLVSGCKRADCNVGGSEGHIGILGERDSAGRMLAYHNNWDGGTIPSGWPYPRKWMATYWAGFSRDANNKVTTLIPALKALDDLDPEQYYISLTIIPEILKEMKAGQMVATDGKGTIKNIGTPPNVLENFNHVVSSVTNFFQFNGSLQVQAPSSQGFAFVRSSANSQASVVCEVPNGTSVKFVGSENDWTKVRFEDGTCKSSTVREGYIYSKFVINMNISAERG